MTPFVETITNLLAFGVVLADIGIFIFLVFLVLSPKSDFAKAMFKFIARHGVLFGFLVSFGGVCVSLFYSDIAGFAPCDLCWWQRVFIYPQAVLFLVALLKKKRGGEESSVFQYSAALSVIGVLIAAYHYYGAAFNPSFLSCAASAVSCAKTYFTSFGYVTIPVMSLTGFLLLLAIVISVKATHGSSKKNS
jgi:disulfide bond formation protein DsbB